MKRIATPVAGISLSVFLLASAGQAVAADSNGGGGSTPSVFTTLLNLILGNPFGEPGQPNQSCEDTPNQPGNSINAPGSAFNPDGKAGQVYAGEQPQNSNNPKSVSQYDTACARPANPPPPKQ